MKVKIFRCRYLFKILALFLTVLLNSHVLFSQEWYDTSWPLRQSISVSSSTGTELSEYQVQINLDETNFDFSNSLSDGSDIRITSSDGQTLIPFWLEAWDQPGQSATIWARIPSIPIAGTEVYVYYGNPAPTLPDMDPVEMPPTGEFVRDAANPIVPIGDSGTGASLLAENIVYDPVTGHYWMIFANYRSGSYGVGLIWSDNPADASSWNWYGNIYTYTSSGSFAPHILYENGLWYVFFAIRPNIVYMTCSTINGTYSAPTTVLSPSAAWETARVDEPYVFQRNDGVWIMVYMGDSGGSSEQVGYATSTSLTGPYTKYGGNPCIPFGSSGTYDAGTVADPWVYEFNGVYYIGYTVSSTNSSPWRTACATTTDWQTFTKLGVIFPLASSGWDSNNSFRGAVTRINDSYVFSYTGDSYRMGIAVQPVFQTPDDIIDNPDVVFDFYDGFDSGTDPDPLKWTFTSGDQDTHTNIGDGVLTMTATGTTTGTYVRLDGKSSFGTGYLSETRAVHPDQGTNNMIMETGFAGSGFTDALRLVDDFPSVTNWQRQTIASGLSDGVLTMAQTSDQEWHLFKVFRNIDSTAGFQVDETPVETVTTNVPVIAMPQFLMSYGYTNDFIIDWTRIRKWAGADPVSVVGSEEHHTTQWTGAVSSDWSATGNWTAGVPGSGSVITIPGETATSLVGGSLTLGPAGSLTLDPGGEATITGDLTNNGSLTIGSTLSSSGSLIVNGASSGDITYNRQLKPGSDAAADWHLAAPPVESNSEANAGKVNTVYEWSEPTGAWTTTSMTSALPGHGYNIRQEDASDGVISFTGPIVSSDVTIAVSSPYADAIEPDDSYFDRSFAAGRSLSNMGGSGWNLLGNPYTSAISAESFIDANYNATPALSQFDPNYVALYLFDGTGRSYYYIASSTGWPAGGELSATHVQAGQGFFVLAMNDNSEFQFTRAMQEHCAATAMLKSSSTGDRWPGLQLKIKHGTNEAVTTVVYDNQMTTGVDPGYDIGLFKSGQDVEIYTTLVAEDNSINYARQALPLSDAGEITVPVGIDFEAGGEVTFSAVTVPAGTNKFWLEDKTAGTFTDLTSCSYTVTLPSKSYGTGRFYIVASANTPTGVTLPECETGLRIWSSFGKIIIRGGVSGNAICELFDIQGKKLLEQDLSDGDLNTVDLPSELNGVVLVRLTDGPVVVTRKLAVI